MCYYYLLSESRPGMEKKKRFMNLVCKTNIYMAVIPRYTGIYMIIGAQTAHCLCSLCWASCSIFLMASSLRKSMSRFSLKYLIQLSAQLSSNFSFSARHWAPMILPFLGSVASRTLALSRHWKNTSRDSQHSFRCDRVLGG